MCRSHGDSGRSRDSDSPHVNVQSLEAVRVRLVAMTHEGSRERRTGLQEVGPPGREQERDPAMPRIQPAGAGHDHARDEVRHQVSVHHVDGPPDAVVLVRAVRRAGQVALVRSGDDCPRDGADELLDESFPGPDGDDHARRRDGLGRGVLDVLPVVDHQAAAGRKEEIGAGAAQVGEPPLRLGHDAARDLRRRHRLLAERGRSHLGFDAAGGDQGDTSNGRGRGRPACVLQRAAKGSEKEKAARARLPARRWADEGPLRTLYSPHACRALREPLPLRHPVEAPIDAIERLRPPRRPGRIRARAAARSAAGLRCPSSTASSPPSSIAPSANRPFRIESAGPGPARPGRARPPHAWRGSVPW